MSNGSEKNNQDFTKLAVIAVASGVLGAGAGIGSIAIMSDKGASESLPVKSSEVYVTERSFNAAINDIHSSIRQINSSDFINMSDDQFKDKVESALMSIVNERRGTDQQAQNINQQSGSNLAPAQPFTGNLPVSMNDERQIVYGNPNAEVSIVTFEDFRCSFCNEYHKELKSFIGNNDNVNWIYQPFPVLGQASYQLAMAGECIAALEGPDAFAEFSTNAYATQNWNTAVQRTNLQDIRAIQECVTSEAYASSINEVRLLGEEIGVTGTPASIFRNNITEAGAFVPGRLRVNQIQQMVSEVAN